MSNMREASCEGGIVTCEGMPITTAKKLGKGIGASQGAMIMEEDKQVYIPDTQPDLEKTLTDTIAALGKISEAIALICDTMTAINAAHQGSYTAPAPSVAPNVAQIQGMKGEIDTAKANLETLKGGLI